MVKIHVWLPDEEHVGHTSLTVKNEYVSFWPEGEAGKKDLKTKQSQPGSFVQSLRDDILNEGNRQPITVELPRLNEEAVLDFVAAIQGDVPRYQIAKNNCSHVVAGAMMAGANCQPSFTPDAGHYGRVGKVLGVGIWTPDQVLRFARELQQG